MEDWENFSNWQHRLWDVPKDKTIGSVTAINNYAVLRHFGEQIELSYKTVRSVDIMPPVTQTEKGLCSDWKFNKGHYSVQVRIKKYEKDFWAAPLWFVTESPNEIMPEIDVCEAYYGVKNNHSKIFKALRIPSKWWLKTKRLESNLHFGAVYGSDTHYKEGNINHNRFNRFDFDEFINYEMIWERDLDIFYNGDHVRRIMGFRQSSNIIPIISIATKGEIEVKNFKYESI